jgi:hypothetical protein
METIEKKDKLKSPLLNKKIVIALVKRSQTSLHQDENIGTLVTGGEKSFMTPVDKRGNLVDPLTSDERTYLEDLLGIDLNPYNEPKKNFWSSKKAIVKLRKPSYNTESANLTLDLSKPYDFIFYKIALVSPRVAKSYADRFNRGEYEFVILDGDVELEEELGYTAKEDAVQEYLLKNKNSKKKLFDLLRMYGIEKANKQVTYDNSAEWIYNELKKASRKKSEIEKLFKLVSLGEKDISSKIFLADCVTNGLVDKRGFEYRLSGGDKISNNEEEAIRWFEDKRNASVKARFEQIIEDYYEKHK